MFLGLAFTIAASFPFFPKRLSLKKKNAAFWKVSFIRPYTGIATVRNQCIQFIQRFERIESSAPLLASAAARLPKAPHGEDQLCAFCTLQAVGFPWRESTPGISFVDWCDKIYVKQVFGAQANWVQVGMPHMRAMEVRILFSGKETVFGFPYDDISGSSAKENCGLRVLQPMTWECLGVTHDRTEANIVPPGFMLIYFALKATIGMRWSLTGDSADPGRVCRMLRQQIESFPELSQPSDPCPKFLAFMDAENRSGTISSGCDVPIERSPYKKRGRARAQTPAKRQKRLAQSPA